MENKKRNKVKIEVNENRDFKGVWIPKKIWLDENLIWTEKILLVEINSLDNEKGCYAGNEHFSKFFGISKDRVSKLISSLKNKDYIKTKLFYKEGTKEVEKRLIIVNRSKYYEGNEDRTYSYEKLEGIVSDNHNPIVEKAEDINTLNINTINNKDTMSVKTDVIPYQEIIEYLNLKTGKKYKDSTPAHRKFIKARWNEGYDLNDFRKVIDTMTFNWKDDNKMKDFLQPSTLFGNKFDNYLNQEKKIKNTFTNALYNPWEEEQNGQTTNTTVVFDNSRQLSIATNEN